MWIKTNIYKFIAIRNHQTQIPDPRSIPARFLLEKAGAPIPDPRFSKDLPRTTLMVTLALLEHCSMNNITMLYCEDDFLIFIILFADATIFPRLTMSAELSNTTTSTIPQAVLVPPNPQIDTVFWVERIIRLPWRPGGVLHLPPRLPHHGAFLCPVCQANPKAKYIVLFFFCFYFYESAI